MKKICIYGKGGIGKSTVVANTAVAMSMKGLKVAVVGCDPKADSTRCIMGRRIPTVLESVLLSGGGEVCMRGFNDILCIESGGPQPGTGCAGRGIASALKEIRDRDLLSDRDAVIYDVLGDVVCGGFSTPLREEIADDVYLVSTADFMAMYAANNICRGIRHYAQQSGIRLAGVIYNSRSMRDDADLVGTFARRVGTDIAGRIPMSSDISLSEVKRKTAVELFPGGEAAKAFNDLCDYMLSDRPRRCIPEPMSDEELEELCTRYAESF